MISFKKKEINVLRLARKFANIILDYSPCGATPKAKVFAGIFERAILDACRELPDDVCSAEAFDILEAREWLANRRYDEYVKCLKMDTDKVNSAIDKLCESMGWLKKENKGLAKAKPRKANIHITMLAKKQPILYRDWEQSKKNQEEAPLPTISNLNVAKADAWLHGFEVARSMYA